MKVLLTLILLCLPIMDSFSQSSEEDNNIIVSNQHLTYTYKKDKNNKTIIEGQSDTKYVCTQFKSSHKVAYFYNDQIKINGLKIESKGGKTKPKYEPYQIEDIFYSDEKVCYFDLSFAGKGQFANVIYENTYLDPRYFTTIYFPENIFVRNKTVEIVVPNWMNVEIKEMNFGNNITNTVSFDSKTNSNIYTYEANNLNPAKSESNAPGESFIYPHLLLLNRYSEYKGIRENYFNTLNDLYQWNYQLALSVDNDKTAVHLLASEITKNCNSDEEKIKTTYEWVQKNIRYIAYEDGVAGFKPAAAQDVINKKYGDCKGMANLLKLLLVSLGFDARLAWIGTNHIAYDYSMPSLSLENHVICALFYKEEVYYLDATCPYLAFNNYPESIQGQQTLVENGNKYLLNTIPERMPDQNTTIEKVTLSIENQTLKGSVVKSYQGESKNWLLYVIHATQKDKLQETLKSYLNQSNVKYIIDNLTFSNLNAQSEKFTLSYDVTDQSDISKYNDYIYIQPDFRKDLENLTVDTVRRKYDLMLSYKYNIIQETEIQIPAEMSLVSLPKPLRTDRENYSFDIQFSQSGNKIYYTKKLIIKNVKISKKDFTQWNEDLNQLKTCYRNQIVLIKKN